MSGVELTPSQAAAAYADDRNVWLTAGAGSGKTRVLTERILYLHREKGLPLHRILAITFTEKAAEEMRVRIGARLAEMGARDSLRTVPEAAIMTIDALCMRLIQEYGDAVGVDPRFRILDPVESSEWEAEVWASVLDRWWRERPEDAMTLLGALPLTIGPGHPGGVDGAPFWSLLRSIHTAGADLESVDFTTPDLADHAGALWNALGANAARAGTKMRGTPKRTMEKLQEIASLTALGDLPEAERWELLADVRSRVDGNVARGVKDFVAESIEAIDTLLGIGLETRHQGARELLGEFVRELDATFFARKRERSALDFIDLEELAVQLLAVPSVARETKARYRHLLLDECQDTNGLQIALMQLLWNDGRFFAVGDPKQSIYHFRDADIRAYLELGEEFRQKDSLTITLRENFRSRPEIISFVNGFFGQAWAANETLGVPYEALEPGAKRPDRGDAKTARAIDARRRSADASAGAPEARVEYLAVRDEDVKVARRREASLLAERLCEIRAGGGIAFGDMAVLFRAGTDMPLYERALSSRNVPVVTAAGRGFFQAKEVSDLLVALKLVDDPFDDRTVSAVLRSPLVGLADADFATVHLTRGRDETPLWTWIRQPEVAAALSPDGAERIRTFVDRFTRLRNERGRWPGHKLLDALLRDSRYLDSMLLLPFPLRRRANVRKLVALTREIDRRSDLSIHQTIRALSDYRYTRLREPESLPADEVQAVKLMTVHGAKGMEFPLVAIADMGRPIRTGESAPLLYHKEFGVGMRTGDGDGVVHQQIREQEKAETEAEEMRLLYVAMTRAEERLILSGSCRGAATGWMKDVEAYLSPPDEPGIGLVGEDAIRYLSGEPVAEKRPRRVSVRQVWSDPGSFAPARESLEVEGIRTLLRGREVAIEPSPSGRTVSQVAASYACPRRAHLASRYPRARTIRPGDDGAAIPEPATAAFPQPATAAFPQSPTTDSASSVGSTPDGAATGTLFHRAMERIWRGTDPDEVLPGLPPEVGDWVRALLEDPKLAAWLEGGPPLPEYSLFAEAEGRPLRGAIDLVIPRADAWICIDYKTDRAPAPALASRYTLPLDLYRIALRTIAPAETAIRTFLYAVRTASWIEIDDEQEAVAREALRDRDHCERESIHPGRPSELCETCAFQTDCPEYDRG